MISLHIWRGEELFEMNFEFKWKQSAISFLTKYCKILFYVLEVNCCYSYIYIYIYMHLKVPIADYWNFYSKHFWQTAIWTDIFSFSKFSRNGFTCFTLMTPFFKDWSKKWFVFTFDGISFRNPRKKNSQKYIIILFQHTNYLHEWVVHINLYMFTNTMFFFLQEF